MSSLVISSSAERNSSLTETLLLKLKKKTQDHNYDIQLFY